MSFISVEPQSRVVSESHSNSLLVRFDTQLGIITDRYLSFFQERQSIEATYIGSLRKLHRKAKSVDASFDPRAEPTTTRAAWDTVRDNLERQANTHQAFVDILDDDVIKPLVTLKETKDRARKRIEEDLKKSATKYADYAENTIVKLQQVYLKTYHPQQYARSTDDSRSSQDVPNKWFGGMVSALFRGRRDDLREPEPAKSEEVSDDDRRTAVARLNTLRLMRAENLGDGYGCLEELVFTPTVEDVLVKYVDGMITTCVKCDDLATNTRVEVEKALDRTDTSDLRTSFRRSLSFSIPPLTLYRNYRPGAYSDLIFGVPLVDLEANEDNVPKVMRMCIEEIEMRGLDTNKLYSSGSIYDTEVLQLRRRFESEKSFSFKSTDSTHSVAKLLMLYLWDLPEPLLVLSLQDYRSYRQNRAEDTENNFPLLRSKICELHPVHRASLEALLRHLLRVASHSEKDTMTVETLATWFCSPVLRGNTVFEGGVNAKKLVMEDLIQNVHTLFDECLSPPSPILSPDVAEEMSTYTYGSSFLSLEFPRPAAAQAVGSTPRYRSWLVSDISTSAPAASSLLPSDATVEGRLTPSPTPLLSPLPGLSSSNTFTEGAETTTREQVMPETIETSPNNTPPEDVTSPGPTSVAEWRLQVPRSRLQPYPAALMTPQSPPESVLSSSTDLPLFSPAST